MAWLMPQNLEYAVPRHPVRWVRCRSLAGLLDSILCPVVYHRDAVSDTFSRFFWDSIFKDKIKRSRLSRKKQNYCGLLHRWPCRIAQSNGGRLRMRRITFISLDQSTKTFWYWCKPDRERGDKYWLFCTTDATRLETWCITNEHKNVEQLSLLVRAARNVSAHVEAHNQRLQQTGYIAAKKIPAAWLTNERCRWMDRTRFGN